MRAIGVVVAVGLLLIAAFQLALALGAPFGRAAWGGGSERLPRRLRIASGVAVFAWLFAALVVLARVGYEVPILSPGFARIATWVVAGILVVGTLANMASRSRLERAIWAPTSLVLAILVVVVAMSDSRVRMTGPQTFESGKLAFFLLDPLAELLVPASSIGGASYSASIFFQSAFARTRCPSRPRTPTARTSCCPRRWTGRRPSRSSRACARCRGSACPVRSP